MEIKAKPTTADKVADIIFPVLFESREKGNEIIDNVIKYLQAQYEQPEAKKRFLKLNTQKNPETIWNDIFMKNLNKKDIKIVPLTDKQILEKTDKETGAIEGGGAGYILKTISVYRMEILSINSLEKNWEHFDIGYHRKKMRNRLREVKQAHKERLQPNSIYVRTNKSENSEATESKLVHELTHKMTESHVRLPEKFTNLVEQKAKDRPEQRAFFNNDPMNIHYFTNPTEVHARLNQIRHATREAQNAYKEYTIEDLKGFDWDLISSGGQDWYWYFKNGKQDIVDLLNIIF